MDTKKFKIAIHESGHGIMAIICGQGLEKISLKEIDSPKGTDKYLGHTKLKPFENSDSIKINELIRRTFIALGGYASEILCLDGSANIGGDDLTSAEQYIKGMMLSPEFRLEAAKLPTPPPSVLDQLIEDPTVKAFIDYQIGISIKTLSPFKSLIRSLAEILYQRDELEGHEVIALFESFAKSQPRQI
jgi:ATP-dependent Zn protease